MKAIRVSGAGCGLLDLIYPDADFTHSEFAAAQSREPGDGGIDPGTLVFESALREARGVGGRELAARICRGAAPTENVGGPALVALIHAAQVLASEEIEVSFSGRVGRDDMGERLRSIVADTPLDTRHLESVDAQTPHTVVLSDPHANEGHGERAFVNAIAAAEEYGVGDLPEEFFRAQIVVVGGTALVPGLHRDLHSLLVRAREHTALTIITTVYDFKSETEHPDRLWPLGRGTDSYPLIDLLVTDAEEARRLTGHVELDLAVDQFLRWGTGAVIVTDGAHSVRFAAAGSRFAELALSKLPVSDMPRRQAGSTDPDSHDTTGCGDNFAGGVIASIALQMKARASGRITASGLDLREAVVEGIAAGAAAWFYLGGTWVEAERGEKSRMVARYRADYIEQLARSNG